MLFLVPLLISSAIRLKELELKKILQKLFDPEIICLKS